MKILALDLSTSRTGYCYELDGEPMVGSVKGDAPTRGGRIEQMVARIATVITDARIEKVYAEDIGLYKGEGRKQNLTAFLALAELRGAINYRVRLLLGIDVEFLHLSTVRARLEASKWLAGSRGLPNKNQIQQILTMRGYSFANDDESDAIAVYLAAKHGGKKNG